MLADIAAEAAGCERCPLFRNATQTVFGQGPVRALVMLVGEQPGDSEDKAGLPFVGPAARSSRRKASASDALGRGANQG